MEEGTLRRELFRVMRGAKEFSHIVMEPICHKHGITLQQLFIITELKMVPDQTVSQLSDCVGILRSNFPLVCRKLEGKGLIQRKRNEVDRRSYTLRLTTQGEAMLDAIDNDITKAYRSQLESEPEETYETIMKGLKALDSFTRKFDT